ncbi:MAG TPA: hypothetical protein VGI29_05350, partial [Candidatus Binataceae bacterium]
MQESGQWMVAVDSVSLCPRGEVQLPKSGWAALQFDRQREISPRAGRGVSLPNLSQVSIRRDGLLLMPPEGTVLEFFKLREELDDSTGTGIL